MSAKILRRFLSSTTFAAMKIGAAFILLICLTWTVHAQPKADYKKKGATIPPFGIEKLDGMIVQNNILQKGKPAIIAIFSPQCDHCEQALDTLKTMLASRKNMQLLLVTEAVHKPHLKEFVTRKGFDKVPAFKNLGIDRSNLIYFIYTYRLLPQFNIYNQQHKLVKTFTGIFPMDSLKMYLP